MGVDHYENFPVASVLCPARLRPAVLAIYHFARTADDLADEGDASAVQRLADLSAYRNDLVATCEGRAAGPRWAPVFAALDGSLLEFALPAAPLHDLLDAFEQDVRNPPYANRDSLLDYCRRSANPIGRLLLHLYGVDDAVSLRQSDAICTALQLINFWQDLGVDAVRGRFYVPGDMLAAAGLSNDDLHLCNDSPAVRRLVARLCAWARTLMLEGQPLARRLPGLAGWELALVVHSGLRVLEKIASMDHATLLLRPKLAASDGPRLLWRAVRLRMAA